MRRAALARSELEWDAKASDDPEEMGNLVDHSPDAAVILVPNRLVELSQSKAAHDFTVFARSAYGAFHQCHTHRNSQRDACSQ